MDQIINSFNDMGMNILASVVGGVVIGFLAGLVVMFLLKIASRLGLEIPSAVISKISTLVFGLVMVYTMIKIVIMKSGFGG